MAKGDTTRAQNQIDYQGGLAQNQLNNTRNNALPQNQNLQNMWQTQMGNAGDQFNSILGNYQNFLNRGPNQTNFNNEYGGYQNFANTGGFSPQNIQDIRARAVSPTRAAYANAQRNVERSNALAGGNLANAPAALAKMGREQAYAASDANTNVNAAIAGMIQQGKLAGLSGMSGIDQARLAAELQGQGMNLGAMQGQTGLYGATPGQAGLTGGMLNASNANMTNLQALQNQLSLGLIGNQIQMGALPSNYQQGMSNVGGTLGLIGQGARALSPLLKTGAGTPGLASGADPYSGIGAMGENSVDMSSNTGFAGGINRGPIVSGSQNNPWYKSLYPNTGAGASGNYPYINPTNPYYNMFNNPNAAQMNPYIGPVFGGGIGGGQGSFKGGAGGPL